MGANSQCVKMKPVWLTIFFLLTEAPPLIWRHSLVVGQTAIRETLLNLKS